MSNKNSPGTKSSSSRKPTGRSKNKNSPIRPKTRVRTLETAIDQAGSLTEPENEFALNTGDSVADEIGQETASAKKAKGIRLQKLLADRGYGSRRKMETWIKEGKIEVDGQTAQLGQRVTPRNVVKVKGYALREKSRLHASTVLMYNKPEGEICTMNDPRRRPTVFRRLPRIRGGRWVTVGRLDINTSGLLLFTTSGELANKLMHPSSGIEREYRCRIFGNIDKAVVQQLLDGVEIDNHTMIFNRVVVMNMAGETRNKWVHVTLAEGRNREVRKLWEAVGCQVSRLTRIRYGFLTLPRNLRQGEYRELTNKEVRKLLED
jgi:23S rRNA pseudouridine2605 synthase